MRGKKPASEVDAAGLRLAAGDPENIGEAGQRLRGRVRIGRLGIVDEQHAALAADLLHAVGKAGKGAQTVLDLPPASRPSASAAPAAQAAFCALCTPRSEPMPPSAAIACALPPRPA